MSCVCIEFIRLENLPIFLLFRKIWSFRNNLYKDASGKISFKLIISCIGTLCQCIHVFISFLSSNLTCLFAICFYLYFSILGHIGTFGQNIPRCCEISPIRGPAYFRVCLAFRPKWCLNTIVSTSLVFCSHFVTEKYICQISFCHSEIVPELNNSSRVLNRNSNQLNHFQNEEIPPS